MTSTQSFTMNAMLVVIFLCVAVGLLAARFGERFLVGAPILGVLLTAVYFLLPRYM